MNIKPKNNGFETNETFGLLPRYLAYLSNGREAPKGHFVPDETGLGKGGKELETLEKGRDSLEKKIKEKIGIYNKEYTDSDFDKIEEPFEEPLSADTKNPERIIAQIDRILYTPYKYKKEFYTLLSPDPENQGKDRAQKLLEIRAMLTNSVEVRTEKITSIIDAKFLQDKWNSFWSDRKGNQIDLDKLPGADFSREAKIDAYNGIARRMRSILSAYQNPGDERYKALKWAEGAILLQVKLYQSESTGTLTEAEAVYDKKDADLLHLRGKRLLDRMEGAMESKEKKAEWEDRPLYKDIKASFDRAKTDPEYSEIFQIPEGEVSNQNQQEMELLFMTLMSQKTNGFREGCILGTKDQFTENGEENRKKFPFIYNEWLKHKGVNIKAIEEIQSRVNAYEATLTLSVPPVRAIDEIIATYKPTVDLTTVEAEYRKADTMGDSVEKYEQLEGAVNKMSRNFILYKGKEGDRDYNREDYLNTAKELDKHAEFFRLKKLLYREMKDKDGIAIAFTYTEMSKPQNMQMLVEICMKQFLKAKKMVDQPFEKDNWREHYHPTVRRLLIASVYNQGVSEYRLDSNGGETYVENLNEDYYWMLKEFAKSEYFNRLEVGKNMDPEHRRMLLVGRIANKMAIDLSVIDRTTDIIQKVIEIKQHPDKAEELKKGLLKYPPEIVRGFMAVPDVAQLEAKLNEAREDKKKFTEFLTKARDAIRNPYTKESAEFFKKVETGEYGKQAGIDILTGDELKGFDKEMKGIELGYNVFELDKNSKMQLFERLGIRLEGVYDAYIAELKTNPDMNVRNWVDMFHSKDRGKFNGLKNFMGKILSTSNEGVKEDFLAVFDSLYGYGSLELLPDTKNDQAVALAMFTMIKAEIESREKVKASIERGEAEAVAKIEGMTIGDKATEYVRGVVDMLFGPGQSLANRAAGFILVLGALKMAKKAWKGGDKCGTLFRTLFIAGAAELGLKHITGRGLLERAGFESVAGAVSGSYKAALMDYSSEYMEKEGITSEQEAAALYELDKVPFKDVINWYKNSKKENGMPLDTIKGKKDLFPKQINTGNIIKGVTWDKQNSELEAKRVVMHTVRQFFEYVGKKDHKGEESGFKMLEERWGKMVTDPNYNAQHSEFNLAPSLVERFKKNPDELTWKIVMESEMDPEDAKKTERKEGTAPIIDYLANGGQKLRSWTRKNLKGPLIGYGKQFFENAGYEGEKVKDFLGEVGQDIGANLEFFKDEVSFMYGASKYKIRRFAGMHWELVKEGIKLPFKVIYAADQLVVPWTLKTLKQIEGIAEREEFAIIQTDLALDNIISLNPNHTTDEILNNAGLQMDTTQNPKFNTFGFYQRGFHDAFINGDQQGGSFTKDAFAPIEDPMVGEIGYYISETTLQDIHVDPKTSKYKEADWFNMMNEQSAEQASEFFRSKYKQISSDNIEKMMYPVHYIKKSGDNAKLYTFWRMPLPGSIEYELKALNKWEDYYDAKELKHRMPFMVDPNKSFLDNLKDSFAKNIDPNTRIVGGAIAAYASQIPRLAFGIAEKMGQFVNLFIPNKYSKQTKWIETITQREPGTEQAIDEISTAAGDETLAISDFYKKPENAAIYKLMRDFSIIRGQSPYLGILDEMKLPATPPYESRRLKERPTEFKYADVENYIQTWNGPKNKLPASFNTALTRLAAAERVPAKP